MKRYILFIIAVFTIVSTAVAQTEPDYLYLELEAGSTVSIDLHRTYSRWNPEIEYSFDREYKEGSSLYYFQWSQINFNQDSHFEFSVDNACRMLLRGRISKENSQIPKNTANIYPENYININVSKPFKCNGNIMTLIDKTGETNKMPEWYDFYRLFANSSIITAPQLPATYLSKGCYSEMFANCPLLLSAPELPATFCPDYCYEKMFANCTSLTTVPRFFIRTINVGSCYEMFYGCTSLESAPLTSIGIELDGNYCCEGMFSGCTNLKSAPSITGGDRAINSCQRMFENCTSLENPPNIRFTTTLGECLAKECFREMFKGCINLKSVPDIPKNVKVGNYCFYGMFANCTSITEAPKSVGEGSAVAYCEYMFAGCTNLKTMPVLTEHSLASRCYKNMFSGCSNLTTLPEGFKIGYYMGEYVNNPTYVTSKSATQCCDSMFAGCINLQEAPALPAKTLANSCYMSMFRGCSSLTVAPALPATTLSSNCYMNMFRDCISLTTAPPELPATKLMAYCYQDMFNGCTLMTEIPDILPGTKTTINCYKNMFANCTSIEKPPVISATSLYDSCYYGMFENCKSLKLAPELPVTELYPCCYQKMFAGCESLVEMPSLPATKLSHKCYQGMFAKCTNLTTALDLPATSVYSSSKECYKQMFYGCSSLKAAPYISLTTMIESCCESMFENCVNLLNCQDILPSTELSPYCYLRMFYGTGLKKAPQLPATQLKISCYEGMFSNCVNLTEIPQLPATSLLYGCYKEMFSGCTNLKKVELLNVKTQNNNCRQEMFAGCTNLSYICVGFEKWGYNEYKNFNNYYWEPIWVDYSELWVRDVSSSGTFVCPNSLELRYGDSYIPSGWKTMIMYRITNLSPDLISLSSETAISGDEITIKVGHKDNYTPILIVNGKLIPLTDDEYVYTMGEEDVNIDVDYKQFFINNLSPDNLQLSSDYANADDDINLVVANKKYFSPHVFVDDIELEVSNYKCAFVMPNKNVDVHIDYSPIEYTIECEDGYVVTDKENAIFSDNIRVTVTDRSLYGYKFDKLVVNNSDVIMSTYSGEFKVQDYVIENINNLKITAVYSKIAYSITTDAYSSTYTPISYVGNYVYVSFTNRPGYKLTSATYNGTPLNINYSTYFYMPATNVIIATTYTPINYTITTDESINANKTTATINDQVTFAVADRSSEGLTLEKVLLNDEEFIGNSFDMKDYLQDVEIKAVYSKNSYSISTDEYSYVDNYSANNGDIVIVSFAQRPGYNLSSATYNGNQLYMSDYQATFTMPTNDVSIATEYIPISYSVTTYDQYVSVDKSSATINDIVNITITDRTSENYTLNRLLLNGKEISVNNFTAQFAMADYLADVTIKAEYSYAEPPNSTFYKITTDEYCSVDKYSDSAPCGDIIWVEFHRRGYYLKSAYYNGNELTLNDLRDQASFTMPATDVSITTEYIPISFSVKPYDQYVAVDKSTATINDIVNITITDRTSENYIFTRLLVNGNEIYVNNYTAQFAMADYLKDVEIKAEYTYTEPPAQTYAITTREYCTADKSSATEGEVVTLTFAQRDGYDLYAAYYNGILLSINNNQATFTMPAEDVFVYAEYTEVNIIKYYNVSTDQYSSTDKKQYAQGEIVTVTFSERDGYYLASAYISGAAWNFEGYIATFEMPSNDVLIGAEYKEIEIPIEYPITNTSEYATVSTTSAKPGDEVTVFVSRRDGYTPHVFVNGAEVLINGNVAKYIQPSASVVITVDYQKDATTAVAEVSDNNTAISVYPNPARQGEKIVISIGGGIDLKNAKILIYNSHGAIVKRIDHAAEYNETSLKSGVYNGVLIYKNGRQTFRIAVY